MTEHFSASNVYVFVNEDLSFSVPFNLESEWETKWAPISDFASSTATTAFHYVLPRDSLEDERGVLFALLSSSAQSAVDCPARKSFKSLLSPAQREQWGERVRDTIAAIASAGNSDEVLAYGSHGSIVIEVGDSTRPLVITLEEDGAWASFRTKSDDIKSFTERDLSPVPTVAELRDIFEEYWMRDAICLRNKLRDNYPSQHTWVAGSKTMKIILNSTGMTMGAFISL